MNTLHSLIGVYYVRKSVYLCIFRVTSFILNTDLRAEFPVYVSDELLLRVLSSTGGRGTRKNSGYSVPQRDSGSLEIPNGHAFRTPFQVGRIF